MQKSDISFEINDSKFNYRVAIIFEHNNRLLIQKSEKDSFYSLMGGKVKIGESSIDALKREIKEELNYNLKDEQCNLIRIYENFFKYKNKKYHELLYIFFSKVKENDYITKKSEIKCVDKDYVNFVWIDKKSIKDLDIRPSNIKDIISDEKFRFEFIKEYKDE